MYRMRLGTQTLLLGIYVGQEIQALKKTVVKTLETIEGIIRADERERRYRDRI